MYPNKLNKIIDLFEILPEDERRETLVSYADNAKKQEPREGEKFDLVDVRKDEECADTVGVYLQVDGNGKAQIRMTLGPEVQTLTRAMTAILCKGLEGCTPQEILDLPSDFVTRIVGAELVRVDARGIAQPGSVMRVDLVAGSVRKVIPVGRHPTGIAWDEKAVERYKL